MSCPIKNAIISVYDKRGVIELARFLRERKVNIISSGGTAKLLEENGIDVQFVSDYTGFPEILDGRVKTLHPRVHSGILARNTKAHLDTLFEHKIPPIDLVVVNLYPFEETVSRAGVTMEEAIEMIDIGGPTMIRAAAKNFSRVTVVSDPDNYATLKKMILQGKIKYETRLQWAIDVFSKTVEYDRSILTYLQKNQ
ncbi:MAG: IMP cyclohydrolase [Deltaproteobacteria bacterium]|nr:IMP cyclohydrolase [Deltaproteobacteria bacterium]